MTGQLFYKDPELLANVELLARNASGKTVPSHDVATLPGTAETDISSSKGFLQTLAGIVASGRAAVDLSSTVVTYLSNLTTLATYLNTLQGAITSARMAVDLATTPTANLATLAGAISAARMAVDLATTPTANLATLAGAITSARMAVNLDSTPAANLVTLAGAISSARMAVNVDSTTTGKLDTIITALGAYLSTLAGTVASSRVAVDLSSTVNTYLSNLTTIAANQAPPATLYAGKKTIGAAGTNGQIQASSQALTEGVWVRALDANTGLAYVGNSSVSSTGNGTRLAAKESVFVRIDNLNKVYVDTAVNAEGVTFLGW